MDKTSQGLLSVRQQPVEAKSPGDSERKQICLLREPVMARQGQGSIPLGKAKPQACWVKEKGHRLRLRVPGPTFFLSFLLALGT